MCRRLVLPLLLGLLLVAAALPVNAEDESSGSWFSFSNLMSSAQNTFNRAVQTVQNAADEVVRFVVVQSTADQICFRILGCLSLKSPWVSLKRPVPRPDMPDAIDVRFYLYTREQPERFTVLSEAPLTLNGSAFNPQKRTFFVTHGFQNSGNETWMANLKDVLLDKVDGNVFLVDWGNGAMNPNYLKATSNTRVVGREIAWLARSLISEYGASAQQFHFMGHSLGAHISGYAARNVTNVARITAFDPAGPGFEALPRLVRLNKYMADFIDVIHTNAKPLTVFGFGMMHAIGHVDFYLNGGVDQPGCLTPDIDPPKSLLDIVALPLTAVSELLQCSHCRAYEYYTEALNNTSCRMWGHKVSVSKNRLLWRRGVPSPVEEKTGKCENGQCVPIGLDTIEFPARGTFSVVTNSKSPYCVEENSADGQSLEELKQLELL